MSIIKLWNSTFQGCCCSLTSDPLPPHGLRHARLPCPSLSLTLFSNSCSLVMPSNHLILCRCIPLLPSIFPSIRVLATVNNVTVNSGTQITQRFLWLLEQKGHCWISRQFLFFNFLRKLHCFPKWLCHVTVPATVHRSSLLQGHLAMDSKVFSRLPAAHHFLLGLS